MLEPEIRRAVADGFDTFITGLALGVDTWAAEIVIKLINEGEKIHHISAVPFEGVENNRTEEDIARFKFIIDNSDGTYYISDHPSRKAFQKRDRWMVDHAERIIAVFNGTRGGTAYTIDYAKSLGKEVVMLSER